MVSAAKHLTCVERGKMYNWWNEWENMSTTCTASAAPYVTVASAVKHLTSGKRRKTCNWWKSRENRSTAETQRGTICNR